MKFFILMALFTTSVFAQSASERISQEENIKTAVERNEARIKAKKKWIQKQEVDETRGMDPQTIYGGQGQQQQPQQQQQ